MTPSPNKSSTSQPKAAMASKEELKYRSMMCWFGYNHRAYFQDWTGYHFCWKHLVQSINYGWGEGRLRDWVIALKTTKIKLYV